MYSILAVYYSLLNRNVCIYIKLGLYDMSHLCKLNCDTEKPVLRDHCHETTCLERSLIQDRRAYISV